MADNTTLNAGAGGEDLATAEVTFSGDTASVQICGGGIVGGAAESYTITLLVGGAGNVAAGVQRVTLADDDPAVVDLAAMEVLLGTIDADTSALFGCVAGTEMQVDIVSLPAGNLGARAMAASLSTTLATDDTHYGAVGAASDIDGVVHGQLRYIADQLVTIDSDTNDIKTAVELLDNAVDGNYLNVNVCAAGTDLTMNAGVLTAQTQRVTIATDDECNNFLGAIDADTSNMATSLGNLDNAVDGNFLNVNLNLAGTDADKGEGVLSANTLRVSLATDDDGVAHLGTIAGAVSTQMQCDIVAEIPAGTQLIGKVGIDQTTPGTTDSVTEVSAVSIKNAVEIMDDWDDGSDHCEVIIVAGSAAIGKLAANTGVDIGDVDVTSIVPGTAATNLGKARGSALGATDTGVAILVVRSDDLADKAGADQDYTPLQVDPQGALYVNQGMAEMKQASGVAAGGAPGADVMIAAVASKKLVICALALFATSTTTNSIFVDNADNDLIANTGNPIALSLDADGDTVPGFILPFNPGGWCKTDTDNEAVTLNTSAAQDIVWCITYFETD